MLFWLFVCSGCLLLLLLLLLLLFLLLLLCVLLLLVVVVVLVLCVVLLLVLLCCWSSSSSYSHYHYYDYYYYYSYYYYYYSYYYDFYYDFYSDYSYDDYYYKIDPWLRQDEHARRPGTVRTGEQIAGERELMRSEFYMRWLKPQQLFHTIRTVVARYCRGIDRRDRELVAACFHPDATDDHGTGPLPLDEFLDWAFELLGRYDATFHLVGQSLIDSTGPGRAAVETYGIAHHRRPAALITSTWSPASATST